MEFIIGWILFVVLTFIVLILLYLNVYLRKTVAMFPLAFLSIFYFYSFFTTSGSLRLMTLIKGHPMIAYTTPLKQDDKVFIINQTSDKLIYIECKDYFIVKMSKYYEA